MKLLLFVAAMTVFGLFASVAEAGPLRNLLQNRPRLIGGISHGCIGGQCNR